MIYIHLINHLKAYFVAVGYDMQSSGMLLYWSIHNTRIHSIAATVYFHFQLEECSLKVSFYFTH